MQKPMNIQDVFLNAARKEKTVITVYLVNGFQFRGLVKAFDSFCLVIDCEGKSRLVYKHAISTIVPEKSLELAQMIDG